ncbi:MAG: phosphoribosyl-AMP cyclohydrolase [Armatimonadetes bacterium]|nr:phosphoribosyl-AMP cyclohydrolase [Armatimonadota bacterium]NIM24212.1 phosphoribosyl-AMP cyclohydrolase [Armatimonadota bacterium]NIM68081.1 phosphoribosyl-AMP cyclohydrolase [Armatimonadota bacterium]NIM76543.1 phosphoribosyl-AMP cyclohydrolase [Armatimonadota bacterium]NIN06286.1 phosphoribosyl-AMP cyclohydrolase [Armatimonadota bacterium]
MNPAELKWNEKGLLAVIFQEVNTGEVLTLAYMNREALQKSLETGFVHVFRRSHGRVMMKGETSGRRQRIREILLDCDADALVMKIEQIKEAACHEGFRSCFYRRLKDGEWEVIGERLFDPKAVYDKTS